MTASCRARSEVTLSSNCTRALCVPRLTVALRTPGNLLSMRSLRAEQDAQCMPPMLKVAVFMAPFLARRNDDEPRFPRRHHPHAAIELELAGLTGRKGDQARAVRGKQ